MRAAPSGPPVLLRRPASYPAYALYQGVHLVKPRAGDRQRVLRPVSTIEQLEREHDLEAAVGQVAEQRLEGCSPVAGIHAIRVGQLLAWRIRRVIVEVEDVDRPGR